MPNGLVAAERRSDFEVYTNLLYYRLCITMLFLNMGKNMRSLIVLMLVALVLIIFAAFFFGCVNKYEGYTPAIVVTSVEYDGELYSLGCKGDFRCEDKTIECVYHFHKEAQNHIDRVKYLINSHKESEPIITELYNALCNMYEVDAYMAALKEEDKEEWDILEKTGFTRQVSMVSSILTIKIRQLETSF